MTDTRVRTCATCAHRSGSVDSGVCILSGYYITTERKYPSTCGAQFEGWAPKESLLFRVRAWLIGVDK
jgi:hypothetical protein